ncbi:MAG: hypothetical protein HC942_26675 [Microcoleus sp. SU_5_6]|nr:hypothetical protein [Microcoleus sp. SU_5_6]NJL68076.1 hypothetical protein [Microcoleus sp. SM1_3_4]
MIWVVTHCLDYQQLRRFAIACQIRVTQRRRKKEEGRRKKEEGRGRELPTVPGQLSQVNYQLSTINYQLLPN